MPGIMYREDAVRKLAWQIEHPPVYTQGVSEAALEAMRDFVAKAQDADPKVFRPAKYGGNAEARQTLRWLCALIPETVPDERLADVIAYDIVRNPGLNAVDVAEILEGGGGTDWHETPGRVLRQIGVRLKAGETAASIARDVEVHRHTVAKVARFLGVVEAREHTLRDLAAEAVERGVSPEDFADQAGVSKARAKAVLEDVAEALEAA